MLDFRKINELLTTVKAVEYLMLGLLLVSAFVLPGLGAGTDRAESSGTRVTAVADQESQGVQKSQAAQGSQADQESQGVQKSQKVQESQAVRESQTAQDDQKEGKGGAAGTIVLDAGHGGDDPGMTGDSGITEKVLNLVYAQKLKGLLTDAGFRVVMTRETEGGLYDPDSSHKKAQDMQRRVALISEEKPLLTVSIHQNSYQDPAVCGPQVFYYEHSADGEKLAKSIQDSLNAELAVARPRVQKGNATYYILKRSESTTVIVECGFLSNPEEEQRLQQEEYQDQVVQAMFDGIVQYLNGDTEGKTGA